jgi:hypothetical protein
VVEMGFTLPPSICRAPLLDTEIPGKLVTPWERMQSVKAVSHPFWEPLVEVTRLVATFAAVW